MHTHIHEDTGGSGLAQDMPPPWRISNTFSPSSMLIRCTASPLAAAQPWPPGPEVNTLTQDQAGCGEGKGLRLQRRACWDPEKAALASSPAARSAEAAKPWEPHPESSWSQRCTLSPLRPSLASSPSGAASTGGKQIRAKASWNPESPTSVGQLEGSVEGQ